VLNLDENAIDNETNQLAVGLSKLVNLKSLDL